MAGGMANKKSKKNKAKANGATPPVVASVTAPSTSFAESLGDTLLCPICMHVFDGPILQCDLGHTVCQQCHQKLTECPTCQGNFSGTRNYALEQIIAKFQTQLNIKPTKPSAPAAAVAKPVQVMPLPQPPVTMSYPSSEVDSDDYEDQASAYEDMQSDDDDESFSDDSDDLIAIATNNEPRPTSAETRCRLISLKGALQAKGLFSCRMIGCVARLPICRLLNHVRYYHSDALHVHKSTADDENAVALRWTIASRTSSRKIIQIPYFGLFFFIYNVRKQDGETTIKSWVQCARPNAKARDFHFRLKLEYGDAQVAYKDFVYGESSDDPYIQMNNQCLHVSSKANFRNVNIEMTISRNMGKSNVPRHSNMEVIVAEVIDETVNVKPAVSGKGRKKKNRKH